MIKRHDETEEEHRRRNREYQKHYRLAHPEKARAVQVRWYYERGGKEHVRLYQKTRLYGLSPDEFKTMVLSQNGRCAICGSLPGPRQYLHVDHDHITGRVRGLLCQGCNHGLGKFKDSPENLRLAACYLEKNQITAATVRKRDS